MKIAVFVTTAALALGGSAFAQQQQPPQNNETFGKKAERVYDRAGNATDRVVNGGPGEPSLGERTSRGIKRMEAGVARVWNRVTGKHEDATAQSNRDESRNDTRAMGAGPNAQGGNDRQSRMDEAYRNYQSKQQR